MIRLVMLVAVVVLSACGDDSSAQDNNALPTNNSENSFVSGKVTGSLDSEFQLAGVFKCDDPTGLGMPAAAEMIGTGTNQEQVVIRIPYSEGAVGTFSLIGSSDDPLTTAGRKEIRYRSPSAVTFASGTGTLVITKWPAAGGESIEGTFEAILTEEEETVELEGQISGMALEENFQDCLL